MKNGAKTVFTVVAIGLAIGILWYTNRVVIPEKAALDDVFREARQGGYRLIGTERLRERYETGSKDLLLVDTRQEWEYRTGHIKGAVNFPMEPTRWSRWRNKGALEKFLGPDKNRFVVFY